MKKLIALLLALVLVMGMVACGAPADEEKENTKTTTEETEETKETEPEVDLTATEALTKIWESYKGEEFPVMGGDMNAMVDGAPGEYSLEDEGLTAMFYVPAEQLPNLVGASTLMHGMMANNFTCGLYQLSEDADAAAVAEAIEASISSAQWMCGMPEKMLVAIIDGEYVLASFGLEIVIDPLETALTDAFADVEVINNEPIVG